MIEKIKENINNPEKLERLYRDDRKSFESGFEKVYSEIENSEMAKFWKTRLDFDKTPDKIKRFSESDIFIMIAVCLLAGFLIKIPGLFNINLTNFFFYEKNAGIIVFFGLTLYAIWINRNFSQKRLVITLLAFIVPIIYINLLPSDRDSASINLAYIHLPLLMWCSYGLVFIDFNFKDKSKRIEYIKHNGDLAILVAIILISGGILTGITIGLFQAININIQKFYMDNVVMIGLVSAPVVATFIIKNYTTMTNKIAPIIANIFSPLVLVTLIVYLIAIAISGKDPYNDRNFLIIFNVMLLGVMGIIVFSISETSIIRKQKFNEMILFILSIITVIIDLIALSAIFYRLVEYGVTPNRLAVLGSNILIFVNLVLIMIDLYKINFKEMVIEKVELTISKYLPVYIIWTLIVIFGFPVIFGMK
ncbi:MAG: DUF4153 domain-containing protein [Bacteroidetes bacterium]|nr:DUF4153 domain-containing protein [Bacteroidota bacterium]